MLVVCVDEDVLVDDVLALMEEEEVLVDEVEEALVDDVEVLELATVAVR